MIFWLEIMNKFYSIIIKPYRSDAHFKILFAGSLIHLDASGDFLMHSCDGKIILTYMIIDWWGDYRLRWKFQSILANQLVISTRIESNSWKRIIILQWHWFNQLKAHEVVQASSEENFLLASDHRYNNENPDLNLQNKETVLLFWHRYL